MILQNERLLTEIADAHNLDGCRFDRTLTIRQIKLDEKHTFLGVEQTKQGLGTGGFGLQFAFQWIAGPPSLQPDRSVYPLLGVGNLHLPHDQDYSMFATYAVDPAEITMSKTAENCIESCCFQPNIATIHRKLSIHSQRLKIQTTVTNLSSVQLLAEEYCHNFFQFNALMVAEDHEVAFGSSITTNPMKGRFLEKGKTLLPKRFSEETGTISAHIYGTEHLSPHITVMRERFSGLSATLTDEFFPHRVYCWTSPWALCPEVFYLLNLAPGQSISWIRHIEVEISSALS